MCRRLSFLTFALTLVAPSGAQNEYAFDRPPIAYSDSEPADRVAALQRKLTAGETVLAGDPRDQLRQLLEALEVPAASQVLVFSKTSAQDDRISPGNPRAIYFSDECYVGWVPGGRIELAAIDRSLGPVFYTCDPANNPPREPRIVRDYDCLRCHGTFFTGRVPGLFVRSVPVDDRGFPLPRTGSTVVDQTVPFENRWAGWYVTGRHGDARHLGNVFARESDLGPVFDRTAGANIDDLSRFCDPGRYLARGSDIVALMVLEHQCTVQTALTRADYTAREIAHGKAKAATASGSSTRESNDREAVALDSAAGSVVDALLFHNEASLPRGGIRGDPSFVAAFAAKARRSADGDSLRDLDLSTRLLRNRCSYLIHGASFENLEPGLQRRVLARLHRALDRADDRYHYLEARECDRIRAILSATLPAFAEKH